MSRIFAPVFLITLCELFSLAPAGTEKTPEAPPTTQQLKQQERADIEKRKSDLPTIGPFKFEEVVRLSLNGKRLFATSSLDPFPDERHTLLQNDGSFCTVRIQSLADRTAHNAPATLQFLRYDFSDPSIVFLHTSVFTHPGYVQLVGATQFLGGDQQVELIDQGPTAGEHGEQIDGVIWLRVQGDDDNGASRARIALKAPDLATLEREHPAEVHAYLAPVLKVFDAESLLQIDPSLAWQVLAMDVVPNGDLTRQVTELVKDLDSSTFAQRDAAAQSLRRLGMPAAVVLLQMDRSKLSAEQSSRLDDVIAPYQQVSQAEAQRLGDSVHFLLDCLGSQDSEIRNIALNRLNKKAGHTIAFNVNAPADSRLQTIQSLRQNLCPPPSTNAVSPAKDE